jgi:hypothetical protein
MFKSKTRSLQEKVAHMEACFARLEEQGKRNDDIVAVIVHLIDKGQWNEEAQEHFSQARRILDSVEWEEGSELRCLRAMDRAYMEMEMAVLMARPDLFACVWDEHQEAVSIRKRVS